MSTNNYGQVSWDQELSSSNQERQKFTDEFLQLQQGSNLVRVITQPYEYWSHRFKPANSTASFGDKVSCSSFHGSCVLCDQGNKASKRFIAGVIDRKTGTYKVLDISPTLFRLIQGFNRDEDYGNPERYDMDIKVNKKAIPSAYYSLIPKPPKPLSENDLEIKSTADVDSLKARCAPATPEQVKGKVKWLTDKANKNGGGSTESAKAPVTGSTDDEEFNFEPVN